MFSKLARSAGQVAPLVRNSLQVRCLSLSPVYKWSAAQPPANSLLQTHLSGLGKASSEVCSTYGSSLTDVQSQIDGVVSELKALPHKDQEAYCKQLLDVYDVLPVAVAEIFCMATTAARASTKLPGATVESLIERHVAQVKEYNLADQSIATAAWLIGLQGAEVQALSAADQEKYWNQVVKSNPDVAAQLAEVKQLVESRGDFLEQATYLAERINPYKHRHYELLQYEKIQDDHRRWREGGYVWRPDQTNDMRQWQQHLEAAQKESKKQVWFENTGLERVKARIPLWKFVHNLYFGKERDLKNFPLPLNSYENRLPIKYKLFPSSWFDAMYSKTGVSGPHFIVWGTFLFLVSKQIILQSPVATLGMAVFVSVILGGLQYTSLHIGYKKMRLRAAQDKLDYVFVKAREKDIAQSKQGIENAEKLLEAGSKTLVYSAMKENVDLQLEAEYRLRLDQVHTAVKKRLDFQTALASARQQFELAHMSKWIIESVEKSITPQMEKEIMVKCFTDLKALSQKAALN